MTTEGVYAKHPRGESGAILSVRLTAKYAAAGRLSPKVAEWARRKIGEAGRPTSKLEQAEALLVALRSEKFYIPDPVDAELIALPDCLLADCKGIELVAGDCDDLSAAYAAACSSIGIVCCIIGQAFDFSQTVQHVLVAVEAEPGRWFYADPSEKVSFGSIVRQPTREVWLLVPSGKILCDRTPACIDWVQGRVSNPYDRPSGDFVGVGTTEDASSSSQPNKWAWFAAGLMTAIAGMYAWKEFTHG